MQRLLSDFACPKQQQAELTRLALPARRALAKVGRPTLQSLYEHLQHRFMLTHILSSTLPPNRFLLVGSVRCRSNLCWCWSRCSSRTHNNGGSSGTSLTSSRPSPSTSNRSACKKAQSSCCQTPCALVLEFGRPDCAQKSLQVCMRTWFTSGSLMRLH
eukprot:2732489-Amphidinium_carterae.2